MKYLLLILLFFSLKASAQDTIAVVVKFDSVQVKIMARRALSATGSVSYDPVTGIFTGTNGGGGTVDTVNTLATQYYVSTHGISPATIITDANISSAANWNSKQAAINGNGIVKFTGTTPSFLTTLDSTVVSNLHSQTYYDLRYGSVASVTSKQPQITGTGITVFTGTVPSFITNNSANWNTAFSWGNWGTAGLLPMTTALTTFVPFTGGTLTGILQGLTPATSDSSLKFGTTGYVKNVFAQIVRDTIFAGGGIGVSRNANGTSDSLYLTSGGGGYVTTTKENADSNTLATAINLRRLKSDTTGSTATATLYQTQKKTDSLAAIIRLLPRSLIMDNTKYTNPANLTENTVFTYVIPANTLGINSSLYIYFLDSMISNTNSRLIKIKLNGTQIAQNNQSSTASSFSGFTRISNRGLINSQIAPPANNNVSGFGGSGTATSLYNFDFSTNVTLTVTLQTPVIATDIITLESINVVIYP